MAEIRSTDSDIEDSDWIEFYIISISWVLSVRCDKRDKKELTDQI